MFRNGFGKLAAAICISVSVLASGPARALASFSDIYFFGDSLSDTGNFYAATGGAYNPPPYFNGRFSDGPVWTEKMASLLGQSSDAASFLAGGKNYAYATATTGFNGAFAGIGVRSQITNMWGGAGDANALYVVVAGGNDLRAARNNNLDLQTAADGAIGNLKASLDYLYAHGARNVMVANVPDLGNTPEAIGLGLTAVSHTASAMFNAQVGSLVDYGTGLGLNMGFLDLNGISSLVRTDALANGGGIFGITQVVAPCAPFGGVGSCSTSMFSDPLHPSARAHEIIGLFAASTATTMLAAAPVPEPEAYAMLLAGLLLVGSVARRKVRRVA